MVVLARPNRSTTRIIPAMWTFVLWLTLLTAAGLCYPRRPRTAGALFIALGVLSGVLSFVHNSGNALVAFSGVFWIGLGASYLLKYRHPDVRAKHVEYWTAKA